MRPFIIILCSFFFGQICVAQITMETVRGEEGSMELYATNTGNVPYTILIDYTELTNLNSISNTGIVIARPGKSKVVTLKRVTESQSTNLRYTYSFIKGDYSRKSKDETVYLIPLQEGTVATGIRMTHIENRHQPREENTDYVGVSFRFGLPTEVVAPRKGVVSEISMDKYADKNNLDFDRGENFIELFHEDGSLTKIMVLSPGSEKVKLGQVVFPGDVIAESAGEDYNSGFHVRLANMKPVKDGTAKLNYEMTPMKFISKEGVSDISEMQELVVVHPEEVVTAEMSKKEKKTYEAGN
ncbi:M23 family metallopeptidase [Algoriphagus aquimarinus]|uniref:M23 family metallopeptidase n=1 Tax=Algoriphagus aquimarinus TaxID=237018 RepID=A0A5C7AWA3_9BACT|nr:M23 family metallopeptidase [Algoriphagus aquimarinus]TXE12557.1 M23 family metallopeptidase [Algoriphagus aquimarinus]